MFGFSPAMSKEDRAAHAKRIFSDLSLEDTKRFAIILLRLCERELESMRKAVADYYCTNCGLTSENGSWPCGCEKDDHPNVDDMMLAGVFNDISKEGLITLLSCYLALTTNDHYLDLYEIYKSRHTVEHFDDNLREAGCLLALRNDELLPMRKEAIDLARKVEKFHGKGQATKMVDIAQTEDAKQLAKIRDDLFNTLNS